jgi:hypothetical protein
VFFVSLPVTLPILALRYPECVDTTYAGQHNADEAAGNSTGRRRSCGARLRAASKARRDEPAHQFLGAQAYLAQVSARESSARAFNVVVSGQYIAKPPSGAEVRPPPKAPPLTGRPAHHQPAPTATIWVRPQRRPRSEPQLRTPSYCRALQQRQADRQPIARLLPDL